MATRPTVRFNDDSLLRMYHTAVEHGFPVDSMSEEEFLPHVRIVSPELFNRTFPFRPKVCFMSVPRRAQLFFDGKTLFWLEEGDSTSWPAYSGRESYWRNNRFAPEDQKAVNLGPLPEGTFLVPQSRFQERPDDLWISFKGIVGGGTWPGGYDSWGDQRVWLEPQTGDMYGRDNFSIHGGTVPGSAGCIDLVDSMPAFAARFRAYGKDMVLMVKYEYELPKPSLPYTEGIPKLPMYHPMLVK